MNVLLFDGSPKTIKSTSSLLLRTLEKKFLEKGAAVSFGNGRNHCVQDNTKAVQVSDSMIIALPLYVDGLPSHLLACLENMEEQLRQSAQKATVYGLVNCGFFEGHQADGALNILRLWCEKSGLTWGGGIGLGAGGMLSSVPLDNGPGKKIGKALDELVENGMKQKPIENTFVEPNFPRILYLYAAHLGWWRQGKKNGLGRKDLYKKLV